MKIIPSDNNGKVEYEDSFPEYLDKEIVLYYYIGKITSFRVHRLHLSLS